MLIGRLRRSAAPVRLLPLLWFVLLVSGRSPVHACAMGHAAHGEAGRPTADHHAHEQAPAAPEAPCTCLDNCCLTLAPPLPSATPRLTIALAVEPAPVPRPTSREVPSTAGTLHPYPTAPPLPQQA